MHNLASYYPRRPCGRHHASSRISCCDGISWTDHHSVSMRWVPFLAPCSPGPKVNFAPSWFLGRASGSSAVVKEGSSDLDCCVHVPTYPEGFGRISYIFHREGGLRSKGFFSPLLSTIMDKLSGEITRACVLVLPSRQRMSTLQSMRASNPVVSGTGAQRATAW